MLDADGRRDRRHEARGATSIATATGTALSTSGSAVSPTTAASFVLLQRRSHRRTPGPGHSDVAVGGHLRAGETLAEAVREAEEEIGLAVTLDELVRARPPLRAQRLGTDNEVQEVFAVRSDRRLDEYRLHEDEVDARRLGAA